MSETAGSTKWGNVFNTPLECGMRSASLLLAAYPGTCDLQRLVQYDYLIVHSGDVEGGPQSIHPATPQRSGELLMRRSLVEAGIKFMIHRGVINYTFSGDGISYVAGEYAVAFLRSLTTNYAKQLQERAAWVISRFQDLPDQVLQSFMRNQWSQWGAEFVHEAILGGIDE